MANLFKTFLHSRLDTWNQIEIFYAWWAAEANLLAKYGLKAFKIGANLATPTISNNLYLHK